MEVMPENRELVALREENRRLRALLELREDRSEIERYQIQSRNKLVGIAVVAFVVMGASFIYNFETKRELTELSRQLGRTAPKHGAAITTIDAEAPPLK